MKRQPAACYYCGVPADTVDHVVPRHFLEISAEIGCDGFGNRKLTVTSCRECNSLLSGDLHATLAERRLAVKSKLRRKYAGVLRVPRWDDSELEALEPSLRSAIVEAEKKKQEIRKRLSWAGSGAGEVTETANGASQTFAVDERRRLRLYERIVKALTMGLEDMSRQVHDMRQSRNKRSDDDGDEQTEEVA